MVAITALTLDKVDALVKAVRVIGIVNAVVSLASAIIRISSAESLAFRAIGVYEAVFLSCSRNRSCRTILISGIRTTIAHTDWIVLISNASCFSTNLQGSNRRLTISLTASAIEITLASIRAHWLTRIVRANHSFASRIRKRIGKAGSQASRVTGIAANRRSATARISIEYRAVVIHAEQVVRILSAEVLTRLIIGSSVAN